jgi:Flp pilus assembly protein TadG
MRRGPTLRRAAGRLFRNRAGAAALEFAIIAPLLFASVLGTFEAGHAIYEQNHLGAAVAAGARVVTVKGAADDTAIRAAIEAKFSDAQQEKLAITLTEETISGQTFKKIVVSYDYDLLVNFGHAFSGFTLTATRYAPAL